MLLPLTIFLHIRLKVEFGIIGKGLAVCTFNIFFCIIISPISACQAASTDEGQTYFFVLNLMCWNVNR